jgi:hypothetical protein
METEGSSGPAGRPRPWLVVALVAVAGLALMSWLMSGKSAAPMASSSNPRTPARTKGVESIDPAELDVHLEALKRVGPATAASDRNPFRFYVKPAPPPSATPPRAVDTTPALPPGPIVPPGPPPIPLKYIGWIDVPKVGKVAAFSDCRMTMRGREGEIIAGQYRLVRIGVESVVMEYVDGRGRTTIRQSGQECVGK